MFKSVDDTDFRVGIDCGILGTEWRWVEGHRSGHRIPIDFSKPRIFPRSALDVISIVVSLGQFSRCLVAGLVGGGNVQPVILLSPRVRAFTEFFEKAFPLVPHTDVVDFTNFGHNWLAMFHPVPVVDGYIRWVTFGFSFFTELNNNGIDSPVAIWHMVALQIEAFCKHVLHSFAHLGIGALGRVSAILA